MRNKTLRRLSKILLMLGTCSLAAPASQAQIPNPAVGFNPAVNYSLPNFSQSPILKKFVDSLPGLNAPNHSTNGNYIPVAIPDQTTYPDADYYEISEDEYQQQLASDLPGPTWLRGYKQTNTTDPTVSIDSYLGAMIIAHSFNPTQPPAAAGPWAGGNGRPVRLKVTNKLPVTTTAPVMGEQDSFLPIDTTLMGASMGPNGGTEIYAQNRTTVHLHGGYTPWISDGTPHQWFIPAGQATSYTNGASFQNVPDMLTNGTSPCAAKGNPSACITPSPGDGLGTYYYTNQQSARLMFYHDHAQGITRTNVYAGMAAPYLLVDSTEEGLISSGTLPDQAGLDLTPGATGGGVYRYGIPLVIQDKSFVNEETTAPIVNGVTFPGVLPAPTSTNDPLWDTYLKAQYHTTGNLWYPHEYMPNEDIYSDQGYNVLGRWDYGPFMNPPMVVNNYTLPSPTVVPEQYGDTPVINGCPYPFINLPNPVPVRFRILSVPNERVVNLQLYYAADQYGNVCKADPVTGLITATKGPNVGGTVLQSDCTEVAMVPAVPPSNACTTPTQTGGAGLAIAQIDPATGTPINGTGLPAGCTPTTWPTDGRDGGVPDPATAGPPIIQIGSEGGLMPAAAVIPAQPLDFEYNRRAVTILDTTSHALMMAPAERADVIVDFTSVPAGSSLILYNDNAAPTPLYDTRNDYYTGDPDQTAVGGAPPTVAGWGPNTRTLMQINLQPGGIPGTPVNINTLNTALAAAYGASQQKPIVPNSAYDAAFGTTTTRNAHVQNVDDTINLTGKPQPVAQVVTTVPGAGYTTAPTVTFIGGGCMTEPTGTANLNGVTGITVTSGGAGYTSAPTVTVGKPNVAGGLQATAVAQISGGVVTAINMVSLGSGYTTVPTVTLAGGGFTTAAAATATVSPNSVGQITLSTPGAGCTSAPQVFLMGGGGTGATASAILNGDTILDSIGITEGFDMEYGRMNVIMSTAPNLLNPNAVAPVAGAVPGYHDPPSDYWYPGQNKVFRVTHLGVDSHGIHLHLGTFQLVNRVDWTNTYMPPDANELGWKEVFRTYPFTDLVLASNIPMMWLPFKIPHSVRYLDPTMPPGNSSAFPATPPVAGQVVPAAISNVLTDFGWEYVFHCHYLDHEENDMMRPMVFEVNPPPAPTGLTATVNASPLAVSLSWVDPTTTSTGTPPTGYTVQRATNTAFTTGLTSFDVPGGTVATYLDPTVTANTLYYYRVASYNAAGTSAWSNVVNLRTIIPPSGLAATLVTTTTGRTTRYNVTLTWTLPPGTIASLTLQRSTSPTFATGVTSTRLGGTVKTYTYRNVAKGTYYYRIMATITGVGSSPYSAATPALVVP